jgi:hypothetical protein
MNQIFLNTVTNFGYDKTNRHSPSFCIYKLLKSEQDSGYLPHNSEIVSQ